MRIFLAGIMQGSHLGALLHQQNYRDRLRELLAEHWPEAQVYDPLADHQQSLDYTAEQGRGVFLHHNAMCASIDLLIAVAPEATMGTAIEMWEAWHHGKHVVAISPLEHNWVIRFCSHLRYEDIESFAADLDSGELRRKLAQIKPQPHPALPRP